MKNNEKENDISHLMAILSTMSPNELIQYSKPSTLEDISNAVAELQRVILAEDSKFNAVNTKLQQVDAKFDDITNRINEIDPDADVAQVQQALDELSKYVKHYLKLNEEQEKQIENKNTITETLKNSKTVTIEDGSVCEVVIPEVTSTTTVIAALDDYTSLELTSAKGVTLTNTANNVVDLDITAPESGSVPTITLNGNFNEINVSNASIKVNGLVNKININENNKKAISINGKLNEDTEINSESDKNITLSNSNDADLTNLTLAAPNATVTLNGSYNTVSSNVSDNTLIINSGAHIKKLVVQKGNVIVKDRDIDNRIDEVINETEYTVTSYITKATTMSEINSGMQIGGITKVENNIDAKGSGVAFGILASGNVELDLNGKTIKGGRTNTGLMFIRGTSNINIVGEGTLENNNETYGIWVSSANATVNIYSGNYIANVHCLYAENGTINIYGGTFKLNDENKTFLLNCLDASYKSGKAKINVYGGKFYGFNPAESMSEPGGPISFVAPGYHVNQLEEEGQIVYEVVAD